MAIIFQRARVFCYDNLNLQSRRKGMSTSAVTIRCDEIVTSHYGFFFLLRSCLLYDRFLQDRLNCTFSCFLVNACCWALRNDINRT